MGFIAFENCITYSRGQAVLKGAGIKSLSAFIGWSEGEKKLTAAYNPTVYSQRAAGTKTSRVSFTFFV